MATQIVAVAIHYKIMSRFGITSFVLLFGLTIVSCDRSQIEPDYPFKIVVKTKADSSLAQNVFVEVNAPVPGSQVFLEGFSDERGEVSFEYGLPATLVVRASRGKRPDYTWMGCTEVRLLPNEEVVKTVYIEPYDTLLVGCSFDR